MRNRHLASWAALAVILAAPNSCATKPSPPPPITAAPINPIPAMPAPMPTQAIHLLKASYYGHQFDGKKTTSGERYQPEKLTAASKTLPLGTVVKVENPKNGKAVKVRINDRGPFVKGRSLDLSHRAAEKIGIIHKGVAPVKVTIPKEAATTAGAEKDAPPAPGSKEASAAPAASSP